MSTHLQEKRDVPHGDAEMAAIRRELQFRNVMMHLLAHPEFYESLDRYEPNDQYRSLAASMLPDTWRIVKDRIWQSVLTPTLDLPVQGWKIHVSTTMESAEAILRAVIPVCVEMGVPFKFAADRRILTLLNSRTWDRGAAGKFMTIYPSSLQQFKELLERLYVRLREFEGPYILSDRRYKDCKVLHYRYGGIKSMDRQEYDGTHIPIIYSPEGHEVPDLRQPYFALPPWVQDPFPAEEESHGDEEMTLKSGRYLVTEALSFSNAGGVYKGIDGQTGREVIIKEARPHTHPGPKGHDTVYLREKEWRILNLLKDTGLTPEPIDLFWEWEHLFLVESFEQGVAARSLPAMENTVFVIDPEPDQIRAYYQRVIEIARNLARALQVLRDRAIIFGDLSVNNVLVRSDNSIRLIDVEGAYQAGIDDVAFLFTPGFTPSDRIQRLELRYTDDYYALGGILLWMVFPVTSFLEINPRALQIFLDEIERDCSLPGELKHLIIDLMDPQEERRPDPQTVLKRLEGAEIRPKAQPTQVALPAEQVQQTLTGMADFILHHASPDRYDRLFPADPNIRNPLNVAYGALGVATFLHRVKGEVAPFIMNWIHGQVRAADRYPHGLFVGLSGVAWALSDLGEVETAAHVLTRTENHRHLFKAADMFYGMAGFGMASLKLWRMTGTDRHLQWAVRAGEWLLKTRGENEQGSFWPTPDGNTMIGYARGASGISLYLLYLYLVTRDERFRQTSREALRFDLSHGQKVSHALSFPEEIDSTRILYPYWRRGSAGVGTSLVRYLAVTGDQELAQYLEPVSADCRRKYAIFPGLFDGLAGLGNFMLDCHQFTGNDRFLGEAHRAASGVMLFRTEREDGIAFPGDTLYRFSTDLGTGSAGIGLFLHRLITGGANFNFMLDELLPQGARIN